MAATDPHTSERAREEILRLLDQRGPEKTICPSEVRMRVT